MPDFSNSIIYKIVCNITAEVYIGSSTLGLKKLVEKLVVKLVEKLIEKLVEKLVVKLVEKLIEKRHT